jgi:hypothetical protein
MSVVFDAKSQAAGWSGAASGVLGTWNHTPTGTPTGIIVGVVNYNGFGASGVTISVTYGGTSMGVAAINQTTYGVNGTFSIFGLVNPASGTQSVVVTSVDGNQGDYGSAFAISVTGSDLTTIFRNTSPTTNTGTSISNGFSSASGDLLIDFVTAATGTDTISSPGAGQTLTQLTGNPATAFSYASSSGSSVTMTEALSPSDQWWSNAVSVKSAGGGGTTKVLILAH